MEKLLYHYTSIYAFNEIVAGREIIASDCRFLNDRLEFQNAKKRIIELISDPHQKKSLGVALFHFENFYHYCIFSLSQSAEILSQWRAYADSGKGVCMGFVADYLEKSPWSDSSELVKCIYDDHDAFLINLIKQNADNLALIDKAYRGECHEALNAYWEWLEKNEGVLSPLIKGLLSIKNSAFKEEIEWRAIYRVKHDSIKTRVSNGLIIPYGRFNLWKEEEDIRNFWIMMPEVWLGPGTVERNREAIQCYKYFGLKIKHYDCGFV